MQIYECKPGNMPEDTLSDPESIYVIGRTKNEIKTEINFIAWPFHQAARRKLTNKGYSWCGEHPRYWRPLTERELSELNIHRKASNKRYRTL